MCVHVLWSPATGPLVAYAYPSLAFIHARAMSGVDVSYVELLMTLPDHVRDDLASESFGEDDTPVVTMVDIDDEFDNSDDDGGDQ